MAKSKRTLATEIKAKTRKEVIERDRNCIFCGTSQMLSVAHYVSRANGGKGVKENLALACIPCHQKLDQSTERKKLLQIFKNHLQYHYGDFDESLLKYKKGE
jgi:5-methylcytosine-specific restriction endonuclease McrA